MMEALRGGASPKFFDNQNNIQYSSEYLHEITTKNDPKNDKKKTENNDTKNKDLCGDLCHNDITQSNALWRASRQARIRNPSDESYHAENLPFVDIEYPYGSPEKFSLVSPTRSNGAYDPIIDLLQALDIIQCYLGGLDERSQLALLLCSLGIAVRDHDGPTFTQIVGDINNLLRNLKNGPVNHLTHSVSNWSATGIPKSVLFRILGEADRHGVVSNSHLLRTTGFNPTLAYGELKPLLLYEIIQLMELKHDSIFLDFGSGVGNVVAQASLQTGCHSYGIEIREELSSVADKLLTVLATRCKKWGTRPGRMETECGDVTKSARVKELLPLADAVLINNERFDAELNEGIVHMLQGLKDGARVVTLKPLGMAVHSDFNDRDVSRRIVPFCITRHTFLPTDVTWAYKRNEPYYYLHRVNRREHQNILLRSKLRLELPTPRKAK
ncbi:histone methylation protein DOT1-domain-containing protein [Mycena crocata]|nr:histone methylation protein DOT1-domain-containing protein [Mycena crocata]